MRFSRPVVIGIVIVFLLLIIILLFSFNGIQPIFEATAQFSFGSQKSSSENENQLMSPFSSSSNYFIQNENDLQLWKDTDKINDDAEKYSLLDSDQKQQSSTNANRNIRCVFYRYVKDCSCHHPESADGSFCSPDGAGRCLTREISKETASDYEGKSNNNKNPKNPFEEWFIPKQQKQTETRKECFGTSRKYFLKHPATKKMLKGVEGLLEMKKDYSIDAFPEVSPQDFRRQVRIKRDMKKHQKHLEELRPQEEENDETDNSNNKEKEKQEINPMMNSNQQKNTKSSLQQEQATGVEPLRENFYLAPTLEERIQATVMYLAKIKDGKDLVDRWKFDTLIDFHRECRKQRMETTTKKNNNDNPSSSTKTKLRCRADAYPVNHRKFLPGLAGELPPLRENTKILRVRMYLTIESHMGITNAELSIAAGFGLALDLILTSTEKIRFQVDVVLPFFLDHRAGSQSRETLNSHFDIDFLKKMGKLYGIHSVTLSQESDFAGHDHCLQCLWKEVSDLHCPLCCIVDSRLLASNPEPINDPNAREILLGGDRDALPQQSISSLLPLNTIASYAERNPKTFYAEFISNPQLNHLKKPMSIVGTDLIRKEILHFESLNVLYEQEVEYKASVAALPPRVTTLEQFMHGEDTTAAPPPPAARFRILDLNRWYTHDVLMLKRAAKDFHERVDVYKKLMKQQELAADSKKIVDETKFLVERDRDWNWCLNPEVYPRLPIFDEAVYTSSMNFRKNAVSKLSSSSDKNNNKKSNNNTSSNAPYLLSIRVTGLTFTTLHEYRSGSWLPTLDWIQPSRSAKRIMMRYFSEIQHTMELAALTNADFIAANGAPTTTSIETDTKQQHKQQPPMKQTVPNKKVLAVHLRCEEDSLGWIQGVLSGDERIREKVDALTLKERHALLDRWSTKGGASTSATPPVEILQVYIYMEELLEKIHQLAIELNVGAVFVANAHAPISKYLWTPTAAQNGVIERPWVSISSLMRTFDDLAHGGDAEQQNVLMSKNKDRPRLPKIDPQSRFGQLVARLILENADVALIWDPFSGISSFSQKVYDHRCRRMNGLTTLSYSIGVGEERDESFVLEC